jgi:RNA polymerase sigma factor (sigma-70 family)
MIHSHTADTDKLLNEVKNGNKALLKNLYSDCYPMVYDLVKKNGNSPEIVEELIQDAMVILYENALKPEFKLTCKPTTYIYSVCRNLLLKRKSNSKRWVELSYEYDVQVEDDIHEEEAMSEKEHLMYNLLQKASSVCKEIFDLFYYKRLSLDKIAGIMNYANSDTVKTQKYKCLQKMKKALNQLS